MTDDRDGRRVSVLEGQFAELLPDLQAIATSHWAPTAWQHSGQLAWSSIFVDPDAPAATFDDEAFGWFDSPESLEIGGDIGRAPAVIAWAAKDTPRFRTCVCDGPMLAALVDNGGVVTGGPFFVQQTLDLAGIAVPAIAGYTIRHIEPHEMVERAACHRAAWSDDRTSRVTTEKYAQLMGTPLYDSRLDWVAVDEDGRMFASALVWRDGRSALVEPVGCAPGHRRRGLAGAVTLAALAAAREQGASTGIVRPRGDAGYPAPARLYRGLGFTDTVRTWTVEFNGI